jgi:hypothetical protein
MDSEDLALLKQVFKAELAASVDGSPPVWQSEGSARADALEAAGLLDKSLREWRGTSLKGYELTRAGRHAYLLAIHQD